MEREKRILKCIDCGYSTRHRNCIKQHTNPKSATKNVNGEIDLNCNECSAVFKLKSCLYYHKRQVHMRNKVKVAQKVPITPKFTNIAKNRTKNGEFQCDLCNAKFPLQSSLYNHKLLIHVDNPRYACEDCAFRTNFGFRFKKHLAQRVSETCQNCGVTYKYQECQKYHEKCVKKKVKKRTKNLNNQHVNGEYDIKYFKCKYCYTIITRLQFYKRHLETSHGVYGATNLDNDEVAGESLFDQYKDGDSFKCKECETVCGSLPKLKIHVKRVHHVPYFKCHLCGSYIKGRYEFKRHQKTCKLKQQKKSITGLRFKCIHCRVILPNIVEFLNHELTHSVK